MKRKILLSLAALSLAGAPVSAFANTNDNEETAQEETSFWDWLRPYYGGFIAPGG